MSDASPFMKGYLAAFDAMLAGHVEEAQRAFDTLPEAASSADAFMASRIERMLLRHGVAADLCALDERDVRGWHYVLTGSILLHVAPDEPAGHSRSRHGRYTYLEDSDALILECLAKLEGVLEALGLPASPMVAFDQQHSRIVGLAAGTQLVAKPAMLLETDAPALLVAYDMASLIEPVRKHYTFHRPGQLLYAHSASATTEPKPAPDFLGVLYERRVSPWSRHAITEPDRPDLPAGPPSEDDATLAQRIIDQPISDEQLADLGDIVALAVVAQSCDALEATREDGQREPLWKQGPVPL